MNQLTRREEIDSEYGDDLSADFQPNTRRHIPEDRILYNQGCKNLKTHKSALKYYRKHVLERCRKSVLKKQAVCLLSCRTNFNA